MISLTPSEIIAFLGLLLTIVGVWVNMRVKIQKIETTTQIKIIEIEKHISQQNSAHADWVKDVKDMVQTFLADNKEEHRQISHDVKGIRQSINALNVRLAELKAMKKQEDYETGT